MNAAFFTLHSGLDREGPGEVADVEWAAGVAGLARDARICDAGCGPGADVAALLDVAPEGHVTAVDSHKPFIDAVHMRLGVDARVTAYAGDMLKLKGPFDMIWSAGAVYFGGIGWVLESWRPCLAPGGVVAFSEPAMFTEDPSDGAVAFFEGYAAMTPDGIRAAIEAADYEVLDTRRLSDQAWENYYTPMEARIAALRDGANAELMAALDEAQAEIDAYRRHKGEVGYLLSLVRPK